MEQNNIQYYRSAFVEIEKDDSGIPLGTEVSAIGVELVRRSEMVIVDPYQMFISLRSPDRGLRKISLKDSPELQHYLQELKKGNIVQVTYSEAVGISLEPAE